MNFTKDFWLALSAVFLVVSQSLFFVYWQDAKYGTFINLILLVVIIIAFRRRRFNNMVRSEVHDMFNADLTRGPVITAEDMRDLPHIVRKWLTRSNIIGKPAIQTLCIRQKGVMRTRPDGKWLPFRAEQFINADNQHFIWNATVNSGFLLPIHVRDKYVDGHGQMLITALYTIPIANSSGPEIDQGTLMRFLAEIIWFPTTALASNIHWEYVDETTARATIEKGTNSVSGIFTFHDNGDIKGFEGMRYRDVNNLYTLERWSIAIKSYRIFGGYRIANESEVTWKLKGGDFAWLRIELTKMKFSYGRPTTPSAEKEIDHMVPSNLELK